MESFFFCPIHIALPRPYLAQPGSCLSPGSVGRLHSGRPLLWYVERPRDNDLAMPFGSYPLPPFSSGRQYYPSQPQMMRGQSISLIRARHASHVHAMMLRAMRRLGSFFKPTSMTRTKRKMCPTATMLVPGPPDWETGGHTSAGSIYPPLPLSLLRLKQRDTR